MIWRNTSSDLQVNNLCQFEKAYAQPIVTASDLNLQGTLPKQVQNDYDIEISLFDCTGEIYIKEVTDLFRIQFATSIYNFNYFNLQLREFDDLPDCFSIRVKVWNDGLMLFNKMTEVYERLKHSKRCYIEVMENDWNDFSTGVASFNINGTLYEAGNLPSHFELQYQQGTELYYLYFDCDQVQSITLQYAGDRGFPYPFPYPFPAYTNKKNKHFQTYAVYAIDQTGCKLPYSRIESTYNCFDNISGLYYGDPKLLLNYPDNDPDLKYSNTIWIESDLIKQPTEIKKEISYLGRTQKVEYTPLYKLTGLIPFPQWKVDEIEAVFSGKNLYIGSEEYILEKGPIFKKDTIRCTCNYLLEADLVQKVIVNEFSCMDSCNLLCYFFVIYGGISTNQAYYDENGQLIGLLYDDLINYFNSFEGVISVEDFNTQTIACEPLAIIKVDSFGYVPSYLHYYEVSATNRIFAIRTDCEDPEGLCDNFTGLCLPPSGIDSLCIYDGCQEPMAIISTCLPAEEFDGKLDVSKSFWDIVYFNGLNSGGQVTMQFEVTRDDFDVSETEVDNEFIGTVNPELSPSVDREITIGAVIVKIYTWGAVYVTGPVSVTGEIATLEIPQITYNI